MIGKFVAGEGNEQATVMFVEDIPGRMGASIGRPFCGLIGQELNRYLLMQSGLSKRDCYYTSLVRYQVDEENSDPSAEDIVRDEPYLLAEIDHIKPKVIVPVGRIAASYFLGDIDMEFEHGLPHWSTKFNCYIFPVYNPMAGLHQADRYSKLVYAGFKRLGTFLAGKLQWELDVSVPLYTEYGWRWNPQKEVAIDTEGYPVNPWGLSYCQRPGISNVAPQPVQEQIKQLLRYQAPIYVFHNALWDLKVLRAMNIELPYEKLDDSMLISHLLCLEPKKLKALAYREAGMEMEEYKDVIKEADEKISRAYLRRIFDASICTTCEGVGDRLRPWKRNPNKTTKEQCSACNGDGTSLPQPQTQLIFNTDFTSQLYTPESTGRRLRRFLSSSDDYRTKWYSLDSSVRNSIETDFGKFPQVTLDDVEPRERAITYSARDADATLRVYHKLRPRLAEMGLERAYEIDLGCIPIIDRMHQNGILIDSQYLRDLDAKFEKEQYQVLQKMHDEIGVYFSPTSPIQMKRELAKLGIKDLESTNERTLKLLKIQTDNPKVKTLIDLGLEYRELSKMRGTYTYRLINEADENSRIHTTFILSAQEGEDSAEAPSTGRLSSRNPNLQNIPVGQGRGEMIRAAFIAKPGCSLLSVDLSQIELRVGAHLAREENMIEAFRSGKDLHTYTAAQMFKIPYDQVDKKKHRYPAKCFHPDTEVLTKAGWKRIVDLQKDEEVIQAAPARDFGVSLSWAKPMEVFTQQHSSGKLIHLKNEGMDLRVTPDHRMLVWKSVIGPSSIVMPIEVEKARGWANAGTLLDQEQGNIDPILLQLAVALQADGSITPSQSVRFGFTKNRKIERLRGLLKNIPYKESIHKNGKNPNVTSFTISPAEAEPILKLLDGKKLPWWWLELPQDLRELVLNEVSYWDSCIQPNWRMYRYSSVIQQNVDVLQALASITNKKTRLVKKEDGCWDLTIRTQNNTRGGSLETTEIIYTDAVACISVPSTFILVRDGIAKIPVICGQSINFGIFYGMSEYRLQSELAVEGITVSLGEAKDFIGAWFDIYPGMREYMHNVQAEARQNYFVRTMFGRIRYLPNVHSKDPKAQAEALRQAGNHPVQGSSGDILKLGMAAVHKIVYPTLNTLGYFEPLLSIHDEIIFEVQDEIAEYAAKLVAYEMEHAVELDVPLLSSYVIAKDWSKLKE